MNRMREVGKPSDSSWGRKKGGWQQREGKNDRDMRILRFHSANMCIYFLVLLLTIFITEKFSLLMFCAPCFLAYCLVFYMSYRIGPRVLYGIHCGILALFIVAFVLVFGWNCGVEYFVFVIATLLFATGKSSIRHKTVQTVLLFVFYVVLYECTRFWAAPCRVTPLLEHCLQIISAASIFMGMYSCLAVMREDVQSTERRLEAAEERIAHYQQRDPLTGLSNRRQMMEHIRKLAEENAAGERKGFCIAVGNVDFFGRVNDKYGYDCGDIVLKQLAYQFAVHMEDLGSVGRWGGDEFLFVFDSMSGEDAYYYLVKLQQQIRGAQLPWKDELIQTTMTYGLMEYHCEKSIDSCIVEADRKMLMGKESGRNTIIF